MPMVEKQTYDKRHKKNLFLQAAIVKFYKIFAKRISYSFT